MKNVAITLTLLLQAFFSLAQTGFIPDIEKKAFRHSHPMVASGSRAANTYDVKYHRLEWMADPSVMYIAGKVTTYFVPTSSISQFEFDLSGMLTLDSVFYHGSVVPATQLPGDLVQADLPSSLPAGLLDSVSIYYHGIPPGSGFGSFVTDTHGVAASPVLWTLSEPYGAKDWWPCKQDLKDKIDSIDVFITCPGIYRATSNGLLLSEVTAGPNKTAHFKHRSPIAVYLVCMAISNYAVYTQNIPFGSVNLPLVNYVYPEDSAEAVLGTAYCVEQMQLYDTLFGIYRFSNEKYGHTQMNWGGGMEHQTNTFVGGFSYELLAHEMGHQWFGDYITCGSWHDIWLNEGFATYVSGLCYEHLHPEYWMPFKKGQLNTIVTAPDGSVYCDDTTSESRIFDARLTYSKGCMILNSLRWVIGDTAFYSGINNYLNDPVLSFGFSRLDQFKAHMEAVHGSDLTWFFNDWYYGQGFPTYQLHWSVDASNNVTVIVNQLQSHASVSFYEMPLPLYFKNSTQDTTVVLNNTMEGEMFTFPLAFRPDSLHFDPELWIISAFNTVSGINEPEPEHLLNVYPSLATDEVFVSLNKLYPGVQMTITSVDGKTVMRQNLYDYRTRINLAGFARGTYYITVSSDQIKVTKRFVKQ